MGEYYDGLCHDCYCFHELRGGQGQEGICTLEPPQVTVVLKDPAKPEMGFAWICKQPITMRGYSCSRGFHVFTAQYYGGRCDDCQFFKELNQGGQEGTCTRDPPQVVAMLKDMKNPSLGYSWLSRQPITMRLFTCSRGSERKTKGGG
jgi:hypothetical protein